MAMTDPIADMLTRIRNAQKAKYDSVNIPGSKLKTEMARVMKAEGFVKNYEFIKDEKQGILRVYLKYNEERNGVILSLERISKPSRRVYVKGRDIPPVLNGMGISIMSTSQGVMSDKEAREKNAGGEVLCNIY